MQTLCRVLKTSTGLMPLCFVCIFYDMAVPCLFPRLKSPIIIPLSQPFSCTASKAQLWSHDTQSFRRLGRHARQELSARAHAPVQRKRPSLTAVARAVSLKERKVPNASKSPRTS